MEDKANGPAVISALRHDVTGLIAITPEGGKVARAQAVSPQVESCKSTCRIRVRRIRRL